MPPRPDAVPAVADFTTDVAAEVTWVDFRSDHDALLDHAAGWEYEGQPFERPIWHVGRPTDPPAPVAITRKTPLRLKAKVNLAMVLAGFLPDWSLARESVMGRLQLDALGRVAGRDFHARFRMEHAMGNADIGDPIVWLPGETPMLASETPLPHHVGVLELDLFWAFTIMHAGNVLGDGWVGRKLSASSGPHRIFLTCGAPVLPGAMEGKVDHPKRIFGPTARRMERSARLLEGLDLATPCDPHTVVEALVMTTFEGKITGTPSSAVPAELNHPRYLGEGNPAYDILRKVGAWPMMDHIAESGECQAEARFILGVAGQLGLPGVELVYVWATEDTLDTPVVAVGRLSDGEKQLEGPPRKRDLWKQKDDQGNTVREMALLEREHARKEHEGQPYAETRNYFEACVRVTHGTEVDVTGKPVPKVRYYAPGAGVYRNEMDVMTLYSLCQIRYDAGAVVIEKVVRVYEDGWWRKPKG